MASILEVYGSDFMKPKKKRAKRKKKVQNVPLSPMEPSEMETELLDDVYDDTMRPSAVSGLKTSVYSDSKNVYQPIQNPNVVTYEDQFTMFEDQPQRLSRTTRPDPSVDASGHKPGIIDLLEDPDYQDFLEYLKIKRGNQGPPKGVQEGFGNFGPNEQFNELLLYIFTGFFILMLFDNIYKLGRDSY